MLPRYHVSMLVTLILVLLAAPAAANTINVPADQPTIQSGINTAADGDTVLVAPGTYTENINFVGKKILVTSHFALNQDTSFVRTTVIDGSNPSNADSASCVLMISGEDSNSVLQGFTLTGGTGTRWVDEHGAGTYIEGGGILTALCSPTIRNNIIIGNEATRTGGASSAGGGGIRCGDGSPLIINNIITGNSGFYGGGIVMNYASGIIKNNIITNNSAFKSGLTPSYGGGGIWINGEGTTTIVENNVVTGNSSTGSGGLAGLGGGILISGTPMTARNNIVWGNTQRTGGPISNSGGTVTVVYSDVEGGYTGEGNIDAEPMFEAGIYLLADGSPCIDAGDTSAIYRDPEDTGNPGFALFPSKGTLRNDMGAYGGPGRALIGSVPTSIEKESPEVKTPKALELGQNYPNPFNPSTTIEYQVDRDSEVKIDVYSLRGNVVRTLYNGIQSSGTHSVHWDGKDNSGRMAGSGVYLYRLQVDTLVMTRKMVLVK